VDRHLAFERQVEEAARPVELPGDQRLRDAVIGDVKKACLATGFVDFPCDRPVRFDMRGEGVREIDNGIVSAALGGV